jgi:hypothetical protein
MLLEKMYFGVLRVKTHNGPRYVQPAFAQRLYLMWMFRHFETLPVKVLNRWQRRFVDDLCAQNRVATHHLHGLDSDEAPILGTVDWQQEIEEEESSWKVPAAVLRSAVARLSSAASSR